MIYSQIKIKMEKLQEFLELTSIHGFQYLTQIQSRKVRIFWTVCMFLGLYLAGYIIQDTYDEWNAFPVLTTINTVGKPITDLDYPALTICPPNNEVNIYGTYEYLFSIFWKTQKVIKLINQFYKKVIDLGLSQVKENNDVKDSWTPTVSNLKLIELNPIIFQNLTSFQDIKKIMIKHIFGEYSSNSTYYKHSKITYKDDLTRLNISSTYKNKVNLLFYAKLIIDDENYKDFGIFRGITEDIFSSHFNLLNIGGISVSQLLNFISNPKSNNNSFYCALFGKKDKNLQTQNCKWDLQKLVVENFEEVMKFLKLSLHRQYISNKRFVELKRSDVKKYAKKLMMTSWPMQYLDEFRNVLDFVHFCGYNIDNLKCHEFLPTLTSSGICYTSHRNPMDLYKPNAYTNIFKRIFFDPHVRYNKKMRKSTPLFQGRIPPGGWKKDYKIITNMNFHNYKFRIPYVPKTQPIQFAVNDNPNAFSLLYNDLDLDVGYHNTITISQSVLNSTKSLKAMPISTRDCRFQDEAEEMKLFKNYTQQGCLFECRLNLSFNICGCYAWNYPQILDEGESLKPICNSFENSCFNREFNNYKLECPHCVTDCQMTIIDVIKEIEPIKEKKEIDKYGNGFLNPHMINAFPIKEFRKLKFTHQIKTQITSIIVKFEPWKHVIEYQLEPATNFVSQLSLIGTTSN